MLNILKNKLIAKNFKYYKNIKIAVDELLISADSFTGYEVIKEMTDITALIDLKIYKVEYLNDNHIRVKLKN